MVERNASLVIELTSIGSFGSRRPSRRIGGVNTRNRPRLSKRALGATVVFTRTEGPHEARATAATASQSFERIWSSSGGTTAVRRTACDHHPTMCLERPARIGRIPDVAVGHRTRSVYRPLRFGGYPRRLAAAARESASAAVILRFSLLGNSGALRRGLRRGSGGRLRLVDRDRKRLALVLVNEPLAGNHPRRRRCALEVVVEELRDPRLVIHLVLQLLQ